MKRMVVFGLLLLLIAAGWHVSSRLSSDAVGMAVGLAFGVIAGLPAAALVLMARSRADRQAGVDEASFGRPGQLGGGSAFGAPQLPVIVVAAPPYYDPGALRAPAERSQAWALPGPAAPADQRSFRIVGELDQSLDES